MDGMKKLFHNLTNTHTISHTHRPARQIKHLMVPIFKRSRKINIETDAETSPKMAMKVTVSPIHGTELLRYIRREVIRESV